mmetsp:Transcript_28146/g.79501  ORF Transcript_28146/g.79501 Transcript_28146/m.79501 type:complete len:297 (-) Transcript_28146:419-1309(-)
MPGMGLPSPFRGIRARPGRGGLRSRWRAVHTRIHHLEAAIATAACCSCKSSSSCISRSSTLRFCACHQARILRPASTCRTLRLFAAHSFQRCFTTMMAPLNFSSGFTTNSNVTLARPSPSGSLSSLSAASPASPPSFRLPWEFSASAGPSATGGFCPALGGSGSSGAGCSSTEGSSTGSVGAPPSTSSGTALRPPYPGVSGRMLPAIDAEVRAVNPSLSLCFPWSIHSHMLPYVLPVAVMWSSNLYHSSSPSSPCHMWVSCMRLVGMSWPSILRSFIMRTSTFPPVMDSLSRRNMQ